MKIFLDILFIFIRFLFVISALSFPLYVLSEHVIDFFSWAVLWSSLVLIMTPVLSGLYLPKLKVAIKEIKQRKIPSDSEHIVMLLLGVIISLSIYATYVYPKLSPVCGGGKLQNAIFVVKPEQVRPLNDIGINATATQRITDPLKIVFEANDYFIISPPKEPALQRHVKSIRLKKDIFDAILYVDDKYAKPTQTPTPSPTVIPTITSVPEASPSPQAK